MNECDQASRLSAYYDGEMDAGDRGRFERHLGQCPECAAQFQRMAQLSELLSPLAQAPMTPLAMARLHRNIDLTIGDPLRRVAKVVAAIAAVILISCSFGLVNLSNAADSGPVAVWESQAMNLQSSEPGSLSSDDVLASWMVQDQDGRE